MSLSRPSIDTDDEGTELVPVKEMISIENLTELKPLETFNDSPRRKVDVDNTKTDEVSLIDTSCDKKWICYISHFKKLNCNSNTSDVDYTRYELNKDGKVITYITRRHFIETDTDAKYDGEMHSTAYRGNDTLVDQHSSIVSIPEDIQQQVSTDITELVNITIGQEDDCSIFLSISQNGQYAVLSYLQPKKKRNQSRACLVFKIGDDNQFHLFQDKLKFEGRAVFLNIAKKDCLCLALINTNIVEIYTDFCKESKSPDYFYDLSLFSMLNVKIYDLFDYACTNMKNKAWVTCKKDDETYKTVEEMRIVTLSRNIEDNLIVTPYFEGNHGMYNVWSIANNGTRLTSFSAHRFASIIAFSKDLKHVATFERGNKGHVKIYDVKSGLLVYTLNSQQSNSNPTIVRDDTVSHARFCYDSTFFALTTIGRVVDGQNKRSSLEVVFEVWHIEAEKLIYKKTEDTGASAYSLNNDRSIKQVLPFVTKGFTKDKKNCLKGIFTYTDINGRNTIKCLELDIDSNNINDNTIQNYINYSKNDDSAETVMNNNSKSYNDNEKTLDSPVWINWKKDTIPLDFKEPELCNDLDNFKELKCGDVYIGKGKKYLVRFGKCMVQLWLLKDSELGRNDDELVYIRAYKCPNYRLLHSFEETWKIHNYNSIKFIGGISAGRILVNTTKIDRDNLFDKIEGAAEALKQVYHTEEIFLPIPNNDKNNDIDQHGHYYHTLESACQALHYIQGYFKSSYYQIYICKDEKQKKNVLMLFKKTQSVINDAIEQIDKKDSSNFFSTMAGSRVLAMLASFKEGRDIILLILNKAIPISIFSYPVRTYENRLGNYYDPDFSPLRRTKRYTDNEITYRNCATVFEAEMEDPKESIVVTESLLTVLIKEMKYDLYALVFNRILTDSKKFGPGCLLVLTDALIYLQKEGLTDLLLKSSKKLSYLAIEQQQHWSLLKYKEMPSFISNTKLWEKSYSSTEQMHIYNRTGFLKYKLVKYLIEKYKVDSIGSLAQLFLQKYFLSPLTNIFQKKNMSKNHAINCVVPILYLNTYDILPIEVQYGSTLRPSCDKKLKQLYKKISLFVSLASNDESSDSSIFTQGDMVLEAMLDYKWKTFIRKKFAIICFIHSAYYISYCTGVLFAKEMYGYNSTDEERRLSSSHQHIASISILLFFGLIFFIQEARQIFHTKMNYFSSGYNWVDCLALVLPLITFFQLVFNGDYFYEVSSVSTLVLWLHAILRLRAISFIGIAIETVIQLIRTVAPILFLFLIVVFAFTHSFIVLLRQRSDEFFQENYNGTTSFSVGETSTVGSTTLYDISSSNGFSDPYKAFYQVWLFIFGVWDPITNGDAGDNRMLFTLCILFALVTVLIFTNMVIAIMSSTVEVIRTREKSVWVSHFAAVIAEIEQFWCTQHSREDRNNNPAYIYYFANINAVRNKEEELRQETKRLREILKTEEDDD